MGLVGDISFFASLAIIGPVKTPRSLPTIKCYRISMKIKLANWIFGNTSKLHRFHYIVFPYNVNAEPN